MAQHIDAKPDELREQSGKIQGVSDKIGEAISDFQGVMDFLNGSWKGAAQQAFDEQFTELKPSFIQMQELAAKISTQLNQSANSIEENDAAIARGIRG